MITNTGITLFNQYYNKTTGLTEYHRTYIMDVMWQSEQKVNISDKGLRSADVVSIFIPLTADTEDKTYIGPKAYAKLHPDDLKFYFTFTPNDKVVREIIDFQVTHEKGNTIKHLEDSFDGVINIMSIKKQTHGGIGMHHFHLGGQ